MAKCLVIDDSFFSRHMMAKAIKAIGHEVVEAEGGQEGLDQIKNGSYDLIFLDLLMPEVDGFDVLETLQKAGETIPVVVVTSDIQETSKTRSLELGAVEFANKPLFKHQDKLCELIDSILVK